MQEDILPNLPEDWLSAAIGDTQKTELDIVAEGRGGELPGEYAGQAARGIASMAAAVPDLLAVPFSALGFEGPEEGLRGVAEGIRQGAYDIAGGSGSPDLQGLFSSQVAGAGGSAVGFMAGGGTARAISGLVGKGMSTMQAAGLVGAMQSGPSQYFEAKGHGADEGEALLALAIGSGAGYTERFGVVGDVLGRLDRRSGGALKRSLLDYSRSFVVGGLREAPEEAAQEIFQTAIQDIGAQHLYDSEREVLGAETFEAGGVGAIVGFLLGGAGSVAQQALGPSKGDQRQNVEPEGTSDAEPGGGSQASEGKPDSSQEGQEAGEHGDLPVDGSQEVADSHEESDADAGDNDPGNLTQGVTPEPVAPGEGSTEPVEAPKVSTGDAGRDRVVSAAMQAYQLETGATLKSEKPKGSAEEAAVAYLDARGIDGAFVSGLAPGLPGAEVGGVVLLPSGSAEDVVRGLVRHEVFHTRDEETKAEVIRRFQAAAPDLYRVARETYRRGYAEARGKDVKPEILPEEATAQGIEFLTGILDAMEQNPNAVADAVARDPGLFAWIGNQIRQVLHRLGLADSPEAKRLQAFVRQTAVTQRERSAAMNPKLATQAVEAAEIFAEALAVAEGGVAAEISKGAPKFAVKPDDVRATKEQIEEGLDPDGKIGTDPYSRAVESKDPTVRAWMHSLDEQMRAGGDPDVVSREEQTQRATRALASGRDAEIERLRQKMTPSDTGEIQLLEPWEMKAVSQILNEDFLSPDSEVVESTIELAELYRQNRTEVARALGVIREALPSTPEEQLSDMLSWRSEWIEFNMAKAKARSTDVSLTEGQRKAGRIRMSYLRSIDAKKHMKARKRLEAAGYPPDLVSKGWFSDLTDMARIGRIIGSSKGMAWDKAKEWRYISMLSNPTTWARNVWGNMANVVYQDGLVRTAQAMANIVIRDPDSPTMREQVRYFKAVLPSLIAGAKYGVQGYRAGLPAWEIAMGRAGVKPSGETTKIETAPQETIAAKAAMPFKKLSSHMLVAQDEMAKAFIAAAETSALAYREARKEGLEGRALEERVDEISNDFSHPIHQQSYLTAKDRTFQSASGDLLKRFEGFRTGLNQAGALPWAGFQGIPIGTMLAPFVHTPAKIFGTAYGHATSPITALFHALSAQWIGDKGLAVRDIGKAATSMGVWLTIFSFVFSDDEEPVITGAGSLRSGERNLEYRTNRAPYSVQSPWGRISYRNFDPAATQIAAAVDAMEAAKKAAETGDTSAFLAGAQEAFQGIFRQANDKTYLQTISDISNMVEDSRRQGAAGATARFMESQVTSFIPNVFRGTARATDEFYRERTMRDLEGDGSIWDDFLGTILYQSFPAPGRAPAIKHDVWGRPIRRIPEGFPRSASVILRMAGIEPVASNPALKVDQAILRYNQSSEDPYYPGSPATYTMVNKVKRTWTDEEYSEYVRRSGQRALELLEDAGFDHRNPSESDMKTIDKALRSARREIREDLLSRNPQ